MSRIVPILLAVAVIVFALIDCARTPEERMPARIPKAIWIILILFLPVIGALGWIVLARMAAGSGARGAAGGAPSGGPAGRRPSSGPVAPDDDPEFLARLEADRRRRERERRQRERDEERERGRGTALSAGESPDGATGGDGAFGAGDPPHAEGDLLDPPAREDGAGPRGADPRDTDSLDDGEEPGGGVAVDDPRRSPGSPA